MAPSVEVLNNASPFLIKEDALNKPIISGDNFSEDYEIVEEQVAPIDSNESQTLVRQALLAQVDQIDHDVCAAGEEDSFFVADLGQVAKAYRLWEEKLPQVHAHYAIKCNTDEKVVKLLGSLGANFDCASKNEIDTVLRLGFDASRIVYANPCKTNSFIRHAKNSDVNLTTVDNMQELHKLQKFHPGCKLLIRIATDDESAQCRLSTKFGCSLETALDELVPACKAWELTQLAWLSTSGLAVKQARLIFDKAESLGVPMHLLDIGGGFERETFEESSRMVRSSLRKYFPADYVKKNGVRFIAEPGRFMVANAFTLATHIIARRDLDRDKDGMEAMLYINDGVYGNLNCILFDHQHPTAKVLKSAGYVFPEDVEKADKFVFLIWGPTCDGLDCVSPRATLPANVQVGDWLFFPNLGAYTSAATTSFNGFSGSALVKYVSGV
ncbi:hypothetical protein HF325_006029 [Metschnikowia pulcherrima]|uniref:ornithine decarboxylase n=1 Tax=Metschnikowia pulcherrima TaxID=27326 RepID=A0A8H7L907_9ASCO|nr:hypothetical protein HF325_006029 [Metschnikowia pulcherrima]